MTVNKEKRPVWTPRAPHETNISQFMCYINEKHGLSLKSYHDLHHWSVQPASLQEFWRDAYIWLGLAPPGSNMVGPALGDKPPNLSPNLFPPPIFFPQDRLNMAEIMFRHRPDNDVAIYFAREHIPDLERITWGLLKERSRKVRSALVNSGVGAGDTVAAVISNSADAFVIALAALSLGAIWTSTSCDMGSAGIVDRYSQLSPKIIFTDEGYVYANKSIKLTSRIAEWSQKLRHTNKELSDVVIIPCSGVEADVSTIRHGCTFQSFLERDSGDKLEFNLVPFSHPSFILFSSGTTGSPKCIVHSTGGVALKVKTDMTLQHDVRKTDIVFQYTTTSWVMWVLNFMSLSCGASMLLYDGSAFHPRPTRLLELAEHVGVSVFGTSPRYLLGLRSLDIIPREHFNLSKLRVLTSTGSVLSADLHNWFYSTAFPPATHLISMSGGTDIAGCFVGGTPLLPVLAGEIQCKALGMAVDIFDTQTDESVSVENSGIPGELVCTQPFPSQPVTFLGEGGLDKYKLSYFERYGNGIWHQGDFVQQFPDTKGLVMLGRSDGVLNPSGVRFGSAEIYAVTETIPGLADSICVGQKREIDDDERVFLFVTMKVGAAFTNDLEQRIRHAIRDRYSPRHVPMFIFQVPDIPYTVNGKKCEINVKHIVSGRKAAISGTVANPGALEHFKQYAKLPVSAAARRPGTPKL
ncbi:hypothetical protein ACHAPI_011127 [Fusarium lateritium]